MLLSSRSNDLVATVVVLMILFRIFVSSPRYRLYCDRSYFDDVRRLEYRVFSAAVSSLSDVAPGQIVSYVTSSGSSYSVSVSGSIYFQRSLGIDPFIMENHVWYVSGPSRVTSVVCCVAIFSSRVLTVFSNAQFRKRFGGAF